MARETYLLRAAPAELRAARRAAKAARLPLSLWLRGVLCRAVGIPAPGVEEATPGRTPKGGMKAGAMTRPGGR